MSSSDSVPDPNDLRKFNPLKALRLVYEVRGLLLSDRVLLSYFIRRADSKGKSFPSVTTIAKDCEMDRKTAINAIKRLKHRGILKTLSTTHNPNESNRYSLYDWWKRSTSGNSPLVENIPTTSGNIPGTSGNSPPPTSGNIPPEVPSSEGTQEKEPIEGTQSPPTPPGGPGDSSSADRLLSHFVSQYAKRYEEEPETEHVKESRDLPKFKRLLERLDEEEIVRRIDRYFALPEGPILRDGSVKAFMSAVHRPEVAQEGGSQNGYQRSKRTEPSDSDEEDAAKLREGFGVV